MQAKNKRIFCLMSLVSVLHCTETNEKEPMETGSQESVQGASVIQREEPSKRASQGDVLSLVGQLMSYKKTYVLLYRAMHPGIYSPNMTTEIKTQFSVKVPLWRKPGYGSVYVGYTQRFWFQFMNFTYSNPIRDIDYNPEFFYSYAENIDFLGGKTKNIQVSVSHLSNGIGGDVCYRTLKTTKNHPDCRSRSAGNRVIVTLQQEWMDKMGVTLKVWPHVPLKYDNVLLGEYIGYGNVELYYKDAQQLVELEIGAVLSNYSKYKGKVALGYTMRMNDYYGIYVQYLTGYGDSLYEYNMRVQRIGIGIRSIGRKKRGGT